jgi:hypothetical protein
MGVANTVLTMGAIYFAVMLVGAHVLRQPQVAARSWSVSSKR